MPKASSNLNPSSRRAMLGFSGAAIAGLGSAIVMAPAAFAGESPDFELIQLCTEYETIARRFSDMFDEGATPITDDKARHAAQKPLEARMTEIADLVYEMRSTTFEGARARARMAVAWSPDFMDGRGDDLDPDMVVALFRDLVA